ncbi:MAG: dihydropteridine reductase [bacterium]|nr:dihydropteridine reductase [bacterium]
MNTNKIYAEQIANEYSVKNESKVVALRKLDVKAKLPANIFAYSFGIVMALIFGFGMCLSMGVIFNGDYFVLGIIIGIIGVVGVSVNYPIYKRILENSKKKYSYDIIKLANEISSEE